MLYPHLQNHLFGLGSFGIPDYDCIEIIRGLGGIPLVPTYRLSGHNVWAEGAPKGKFHVCLFDGSGMDGGVYAFCGQPRMENQYAR